MSLIYSFYYTLKKEKQSLFELKVAIYIEFLPHDLLQ